MDAVGSYQLLSFVITHRNDVLILSVGVDRRTITKDLSLPNDVASRKEDFVAKATAYKGSRRLKLDDTLCLPDQLLVLRFLLTLHNLNFLHQLDVAFLQVTNAFPLANKLGIGRAREFKQLIIFGLQPISTPCLSVSKAT